MLWFKVPPKQLQGEHALGHTLHIPPVQLPLQHSPSVVQEPPVDRHAWPHTPSTHSCPSGQRLKQRPQWRSVFLRFTHLPSPPGFLQRVLPSGQPQILSSPRLMQFLEQHWESLRHSRPKRLQSSSAQATPGTEAKAASGGRHPSTLWPCLWRGCPLRAPWLARLRNALSFVWPSHTRFRQPRPTLRQLRRR